MESYYFNNGILWIFLLVCTSSSSIADTHTANQTASRLTEKTAVNMNRIPSIPLIVGIALGLVVLIKFREDISYFCGKTVSSLRSCLSRGRGTVLLPCGQVFDEEKGLNCMSSQEKKTNLDALPRGGSEKSNTMTF